MDASNRRKIGQRGEIAAARYLRDRGYAILTANYRTRLGEVDIIASHEGYIAFVEVKTRGPRAWSAPREAVNRTKQRRIIAAAQHYLAVQGSILQPRFDVIEVMLAEGSDFKSADIQHIISAFETEGYGASV